MSVEFTKELVNFISHFIWTSSYKQGSIEYFEQETLLNYFNYNNLLELEFQYKIQVKMFLQYFHIIQSIYNTFMYSDNPNNLLCFNKNI